MWRVAVLWQMILIALFGEKKVPSIPAGGYVVLWALALLVNIVTFTIIPPLEVKPYTIEITHKLESKLMLVGAVKETGTYIDLNVTPKAYAMAEIGREYTYNLPKHRVEQDDYLFIFNTLMVGANLMFIVGVIGVFVSFVNWINK